MSINLSKITSLLSIGTATFLMSSGAHAINFKVEDTEVDIYGYVKLDVIYDVDADLGNAITRNKIRLDKTSGASGHTTMSAYESRLGFTTKTLVGDHLLKTNIEGDFYGSGGGNFRLRHAYGEWNGILAGQTWSNFGNTISLFPTVDFNGPLGQGGGRQSQIRYTTGNFSYSLEDPKEGGKVSAKTNANDTAKFQLPDMTARYQNNIGPVKFAAAGLARFLKYDAKGVNLAPNDENWGKDSAVGWGLMLEAQTNLTEKITLRGSVTHGDGIGGYLYLSPAAPGYVGNDGKIETVKATGGGVSLSVATGPGSFNIGYGLTNTDLSGAVKKGGVTNTANSSPDERYASTFINYIWSPINKITYGLEAGHHTLKKANGDKGDAIRLQGMVKYSF